MQPYRLLLGVILIGVMASVAILAQRWGVEARSRTVEVILDGPDWEGLAAREGKDPAAFLLAAREQGATSVAVFERTLKRLAEQGMVTYLSTGEVLATARSRSLPPSFQILIERAQLHPRAVYIAGSPDVLEVLEGAYRGLLGPLRVRRAGDLLQVVGTRDDIEEIGVGFLPLDMERYRRLGLQPVLRVRNYDGLTADGLHDLFTRLSRLGRDYTLVFELIEVLGYDQLIGETAEEMRAAGDRYGRIEVFNVRRKQRGEDLLAQRLRPDGMRRPEVIRLFSLTPDELQQLTPAAAKEKFIRAARERNIRLLYLRPLSARAGVVATEANLSYLSGIVADLRRFGLRLGPGEPLMPMRASPLLLLGASLGALAAIGLVLAMLGEAVGAPVPASWIWGWIAVGGLITVGLILAGPLTLWRKLLALGTAATVPAVAIAVALPRAHARDRIWASLRALWVASLTSVVAGVLVGGLLSEWDFMMAADQFLGVKLAHLVPVVLAVLLLWRRDRPPQHWRETVRDIWAWSARPLLLRYAIVAVAVGLAAGILLGRSGNLGLPVLGAEERLRAATENVLVARPRTKEYLIGHPALVLAAAAAAVGWRTGMVPFAAVGAIGQAGIVNSFAHIHTPLLYALWRTANALILGSIIGAVAAAVVLAIRTRAGRAVSGSP